MMEMQFGIKNPGKFAKMQSPGGDQVNEILRRGSAKAGADAPAQGGSGVPNPSKIDQGDK